MRPVLVDTNVLVDLLGPLGQWSNWSRRSFAEAMDVSEVVINPIIYAELAAGAPSREALDVAVPPEIVRREAIPFAAAYLAGRCHAEYRLRGGTSRTVLPDILIGAHAAVAGYRLLTRDVGRFRTYFPRLEIISPA
jgi:predicted nucleic acid-binding protein